MRLLRVVLVDTFCNRRFMLQSSMDEVVWVAKWRLSRDTFVVPAYELTIDERVVLCGPATLVPVAVNASMTRPGGCVGPVRLLEPGMPLGTNI